MSIQNIKIIAGTDDGAGNRYVRVQADIGSGPVAVTLNQLKGPGIFAGGAQFGNGDEDYIVVEVNGQSFGLMSDYSGQIASASEWIKIEHSSDLNGAMSSAGLTVASPGAASTLDVAVSQVLFWDTGTNSGQLVYTSGLPTDLNLPTGSYTAGQLASMTASATIDVNNAVADVVQGYIHNVGANQAVTALISDVADFTTLLSEIRTQMATDEGADAELADDFGDALGAMAHSMSPAFVQAMLATVEFIDDEDEQGRESAALQPLKDALVARRDELSADVELVLDQLLQYAADRVGGQKSMFEGSSLGSNDNGFSLQRAHQRFDIVKAAALNTINADKLAAEGEWDDTFQRAAVFLWNDGTEDKVYMLGVTSDEYREHVDSGEATATLAIGSVVPSSSTPAAGGSLATATNKHAGKKFGGFFAELKADVLTKHSMKEADASDAAAAGIEIGDIIYS